MLVGIYRTDVDNWYMEWYNGGIVWKGISESGIKLL